MEHGSGRLPGFSGFPGFAGFSVRSGVEVSAAPEFSVSRVRALLLDSGGVLMGPVGGRWHPRADFEATVLAHAPGIPPARFAAGIAAGDRFLAEAATTPDLGDYHRLVLAAMGVPATGELLADLVRPIPAGEVLEVFPDVPPTLRAVRARGIPMAVVSDAWPGLPEVHAELGIGGFFEVYAISAVLGCSKPDPRMYHHASDRLGLDPGHCLFVDDDPDLVAAAIGLGYAGCALLRDSDLDGDGDGDAPVRAGVPVIRSLAEVLDLL